MKDPEANSGMEVVIHARRLATLARIFICSLGSVTYIPPRVQSAHALFYEKHIFIMWAMCLRCINIRSTFVNSVYVHTDESFDL